MRFYTISDNFTKRSVPSLESTLNYPWFDAVNIEARCLPELELTTTVLSQRLTPEKQFMEK